MSTKFFLRDTASDVNPDTPNLDKALATTAGGSLTTAVTNSSTGTPVITKTAGGLTITYWMTPPLAAVTISGTITFNLWGVESNMSANETWTLSVHHLNTAGVQLATLVSFSTFGSPTELPTTVAAQNWTASPVSKTLNSGDRLGLIVQLSNTLSSAAGFTVTLDYDGPTGAADGDSWVQFTENLTLWAPPVQTLPHPALIYQRKNR